jgi:prepilin-type N-terminal cleavage/methylation domain-containing protein
MNTCRQQRKGFTLVELLVVMAIATILLAVALPVVMQAGSRARSARCVSNLHQLGSAVLLYSQDWGDRLPKLSGTAFGSSYATDTWPEGTSATEARFLLEKRTAGGGVFKCTNDLGADEFAFANPDKSAFACTGSSYVPWSSARAGTYGVSVNGAILSSASNLSSLVLFRDYGSDWHRSRTRDGLTVCSVEQANAVCADGHTKPSPILISRTAQGMYAWVVTPSGPAGGILRLDGQVSSDHVELTGKYMVSSTAAGSRIEVSGLIWGSSPPYEVDRVFNVGPVAFTGGNVAAADTGLNRVAAWIESLVH